MKDENWQRIREILDKLKERKNTQYYQKIKYTTGKVFKNEFEKL